MTTHMPEILLWFKGLALIAFIWSVEPLMALFAGLSFLSPNIREFILESKELIGLLISVFTLVYIIRKNYKLKNNKDVS